MILLAMIPMQAGKSESKVFQNLNDRARDDAITKFYKNTMAAETISTQATFGKCAVYYSLNPNLELGTQAQPQKNIFCEEA
jgi:hypothetical protein